MFGNFLPAIEEIEDGERHGNGLEVLAGEMQLFGGGNRTLNTIGAVDLLQDSARDGNVLGEMAAISALSNNSNNNGGYGGSNYNHHHHHNNYGPAPVYVATPVPVYVEPAQQARLVEQQRQWGMEWEERARREAQEREKRAAQERAEELQRKQARFAQEQADEKLRLENYSRHEALVRDAKNLTYDALYKRIAILPPMKLPAGRYQAESKQQGLPRLVDGYNLFNAVFDNTRITGEGKRNILNLLYTKGYARYQDELLKTPTVDGLLKDRTLHPLLKKIYSEYLDEETFALDTLDKNVEMKIWEVYLVINGSSLFVKLLEKKIAADRLLTFINAWMNSRDNVEDVISTYKTIKIGIENTYVSELRNEIRSIAEVRILEIGKNNKPLTRKLDESAEGTQAQEGEQESKMSDEQKSAKNFLKKSHTRFFKFCSSSPSTLDVYNMIRKKSEDAQGKLTDKEIDIQEKINRKLNDVVGHETDFRFK